MSFPGQPTVQFSNGLVAPSLAFGTWQIAKADAADSVYNAIKIGYRHIDCAQVYGNHKEVGQGIQRALEDKLVADRRELWITSKIWNDQHEIVAEAVDTILEDLQCGYLDLLLIHWPISFKLSEANKDKQLWQVYQDMEKLVPTKTKSLGISNFSIEETQQVLDNCWIKPIVNQVESSVYWNQFDLEKFSNKNGIVLTSYSPLCANIPHASLNINFKVLVEDPLIVELAEKYKTTPHAIALRWHLDLPKRIVLVKSIHAERIQQNFVNTLAFTIEPADMERLNAIETQFRSLNPMNWRQENVPFFPNY
jgi:alcohol dehydrogenase (NADP+)